MKLEDIEKMVKKVESGLEVLNGILGEVRKAVDMIAPPAGADASPAADQGIGVGGMEDIKDAPLPVHGESRIIVRQVEVDPTKVTDAEFRDVVQEKPPEEKDVEKFPCPVCGTTNVAAVNYKDPSDTLERAKKRISCRSCGIFLGDDKQIEKARAAFGQPTRPAEAKKYEGY